MSARIRHALVTTAALLLAAPASAQENKTSLEEVAKRLEAIERQLGIDESAAVQEPNDAVATLDQRLRVIERKLELQAEEAAAKAAKDPVVALSAGKGLSIKSPDGVEVKFRALVQADGRFFEGEKGVPFNDGFLLRRVEPTLEGSWGPLVGFRIQGQLAGDSATLNDAYLDLKFDPRATLRIGKFKQPFGLEQLQPAAALTAIERGLASELTPSRDFGAQLQGELAGGELNYAIGIFDGVPDGRDATSSNPDNAFEYAGRVFWEPFKNDANALSGFGIGVAASQGDAFGAGNALLPRYRSPGQNQFFAYGANVAANGLRKRFSPQVSYYLGGFGLSGEYVSSEQAVRIVSGAGNGRRESLRNTGYQVTASYVLTGENAGYRGIAQPNHPFTLNGAGWGAFEVVGRYGTLRVDRDAFPLFANPALSAREAQSWGFGFNWYLNANVKLSAIYNETDFDGGAARGSDRDTEKALLTRAQLSF